MSIIQRIQEKRQGSEAEQVAAMDAEMVESQKPDAVKTAKDGRVAYGQALRNTAEPTQQVQEIAPTPEEQAVMTKAEKVMTEMVHSPGQTQRLLQAITSAEDPVHGIGTVAADIIAHLKETMPEMTDDVMGALGESTIEQIVELAELANPQLDLSQDEMSEAYSIGLETYMRNGTAEVDEDELRGFIANG